MKPEDLPESTSDIAIIGYTGRFPGAENAGQFWHNLCHGIESIRIFSAKELESVGVDREDLRQADYVRAGAPLAHLDAFDAGFFGISPREASIMDPQQRFFLESAWEALEHAGYAPGTFTGSTGVFAGSGPNSYLIRNLLTDPGLVAKEGVFLLRHTGNDRDVLATRVSYQMNLRGPSLTVQTGGSTSLVAVDLACQSLLHYGCDMAVAGAVSIEIPHAVGYLYRRNEIQSHDGHCRAFDAKASGTVFGNGLGIVILRRLADALEANDTIHAVIKGTAVNNDGNRKVGFLAPSVTGQVEVIVEAMAAAGVSPSSIDYVETHGAGTPIGDPIELNALGQAFSDRPRSLQIGSVKTNIGNLDIASGMAGLLKTILALEHCQIPPTLHFQNLNPLINSDETKLQVVDRLTEWDSDHGPRRAGVTALGIGGTNAHIVLEEPPKPNPSRTERPAQLLTLSAKSPGTLEKATQSLASHLRDFPDHSLSDIAYTLHVGRSEFAHRRVFVARDRSEALHAAEQPHSPLVVTGKASEPRSVFFLFCGQGAQYVNMGRDLYRTEPVFRKWLDTCATFARPHLGFDFRDILYPDDHHTAEAAEKIKLTWNAQPILFAMEYALAHLWISWGVRPDRLLGHSLGEYPAACLSGIFTLEDAVSLVCARGNLMRKVINGAMIVVSLSEAVAVPWIKGDLSLAAVNGAEQCVISGPTNSVTALREQLEKQGIPSFILETVHGFHSSLVDPVLDSFTEMLRQKKLRAPQIPILSNVTGTWLTEQEATDPVYWARHLRETVRFHDGLKVAQADPGSLLLEIGPGEILCGLARRNGDIESQKRVFSSLPPAASEGSDLPVALSNLGRLWVHGLPVDWSAFHAEEKLRRIPLPTYPFQRKRFWHGPKIGSNWLADVEGAHIAGITETGTVIYVVKAGSDDVEAVLKQLWQQLLGLDQVDLKTDFFDSGGHSLLAVRLFTEIRNRFDIEFGLSTLFEARTVGALAELIREARLADAPKKNPASQALVPIRSRGTSAPLFLIHSVGGNVLSYEHLARHFPEDQAIFAIESRGLGGLPADFSVTEMARHYIAQMREEQPRGPYFVAGHSFGGLIAYEIACQLSALGETMAFVGLIDTFLPNVAREDASLQAELPRAGLSGVLKGAVADLDALASDKNRLARLREKNTFLQGWIAMKSRQILYRSVYGIYSRFGWGMPSGLNDVSEANWIAHDNFRPGPYEGTVVLFQCQNRLPNDPPDSSRVWQRLVTGKVIAHEVPGDHNSILREPEVQILAQELLTYLKPEKSLVD